MKQKPKVEMININLLSRFIKAQGLNKNLSFYVEDNPNKLFNLIKDGELLPNGQAIVDHLQKHKLTMEEAVLELIQLNQIMIACFKDKPKKDEKKFVLGQRFV